MKTIEQTHLVSEEDKALLCKMKKLIREIAPSAEVLLYGSVAKGTHGAESDYDILVLTDEPLSKDAKRTIERQILDLELAHDVVLSTIYHSKAEWRLRAALPFHNEVEEHGIAL
jgi:predicted nucleotidyltransferase